MVEEEDIDIGDDMQSTIFPPVVIQKDVINVGSSESSSESGSSYSGNIHNDHLYESFLIFVRMF